MAEAGCRLGSLQIPPKTPQKRKETCFPQNEADGFSGFRVVGVYQSSRGSFHFHSFQGSFFLKNHQEPWETDPAFAKKDG